jgi:GTP cyclohydrolase IA
MTEPEILTLTWAQCRTKAKALASLLCRTYPSQSPLYAYAIPNGGIPAALLVQGEAPNIVMTMNPDDATIYIDDLLDSGRTRDEYYHRHGRKPFYTLLDKQDSRWVSFPWERMQNQTGPEDAVVRLLQYIGEDPKREGLKGTPSRVVRSYAELFGGYQQDPADVMRVFQDGACDEMVVLRDIEFQSTCEHHMLPFLGTAHVAYIPDGKVIGISKLARILDIYARRLQIQERLCEQVTTALNTHLSPKGAACVLEAKHLCMTCRGVGKQHSVMVTSSLTGVFREPAVRSEFLNMIHGGRR